MKRVGVREFRDHASHYLASDEVLAIERHGEPIGFYIPAAAARPAQKQRAQEALANLEHSVQGFLAASGLSEEQLASWFDLTVPLAEHPDWEGRTPAARDATGG
jgi:hypothetical protein